MCSNHWYTIPLTKRRPLPKKKTTYQQNRDLISIGAYTRGNDPRIDLSIKAEPAINAFLQQGMQQILTFEESVETMVKLGTGLGPA